MKTILVLVMEFFFGRDGHNLHVILGMIIAVVGMIWYGNALSKPSGKERWSHCLPTNKTEARWYDKAFAKAKHNEIGDFRKMFNYLKLNLIGSNYFYLKCIFSFWIPMGISL